MDWISMKSGSDVRGTAIGEGTVLTNEVACALGMAFARKLSDKKKIPVENIKIAVGRDSRVTGPDLLNAAIDGIIRSGASALDFGLCTTPAMYMCIITPGYEPDGSIMITASHHPWNKNGLKFFTVDGGLEGKEVVELLRYAQSLNPYHENASGKVLKESFLPVYQKQLEDRIRIGLNSSSERPLEGLHIVVDAGNGAGGFYADMLQSIGANTEGSQFLDPDGKFPNHIPNPENKDAISSIKNAVLRSGADLGVIFDTDCDRAAVVDADGKEINRNRLIALVSAVLLKDHPDQYIVTDSVTSSGLKEFIKKLGGEQYRYKRGYRNVIDEAIRLNREGKECPVAIETSGHAALKENHFLDDGMYLVTVLIINAMMLKKDGKTLGSLICELKEPVESAEIRMNILDEDFHEKGEEAISHVMEHVRSSDQMSIDPDNREGVRINFCINGISDSGWILLRLSVHDPVLPLNAETDIPGGMELMLEAVYNTIKDIPGIDYTPLLNYIKKA